MGKQMIFTEPPKKPRNAKLAWSFLSEKHGTPSQLFFDSKTREWVGVYLVVQGAACSESRQVIHEGDLQ